MRTLSVSVPKSSQVFLMPLRGAMSDQDRINHLKKENPKNSVLTGKPVPENTPEQQNAAFCEPAQLAPSSTQTLAEVRHDKDAIRRIFETGEYP